MHVAWALLAAIVARSFMVAHALVVVWRLTVVYDHDLYWMFLICLIPLIVEFLTTCIRNKGHEWEGVWNPSFVCFLTAIIPAIWLMEVDHVKKIQDDTAEREHSMNARLGGLISLEITLTNDEWSMTILQSMMFILIIARWLLPKQELDHEKLSDLMLVYIGMAGDILDIFEIFGEKSVANDWTFVYATLGVWTFSLTQFTFILAEKKPEENEGEELKDPMKEEPVDEEKQPCCKVPSWLNVDTGSMLVTMFMQDVPFLIIRLIAITKYNVYSFPMVFFAIKNAFMILLEIYRLVMLWHAMFQEYKIKLAEDVGKFVLQEENKKSNQDGKDEEINENFMRKASSNGENQNNDGDYYNRRPLARIRSGEILDTTETEADDFGDHRKEMDERYVNHELPRRNSDAFRAAVSGPPAVQKRRRQTLPALNSSSGVVQDDIKQALQHLRPLNLDVPVPPPPPAYGHRASTVGLPEEYDARKRENQEPAPDYAAVVMEEVDSIRRPDSVKTPHKRDNRMTHDNYDHIDMPPSRNSPAINPPWNDTRPHLRRTSSGDSEGSSQYASRNTSRRASLLEPPLHAYRRASLEQPSHIQDKRFSSGDIWRPDPRRASPVYMTDSHDLQSQARHSRSNSFQNLQDHERSLHARHSIVQDMHHAPPEVLF